MPTLYNGIDVMAKYTDLTGQKFNSLTVIERDYSRKGKNSYWLCRCDCGNITSVMRTNLVTGNISSCGCQKKRLLAKAAIKDLTGQKFNELTVLNWDPDYRDTKDITQHTTYWKVKCSCGNIFSISTISLKNAISCGCKKSKGEYKIIQFLQENKINYQYQYVDKNFTLSQSGKYGRFDFALFDEKNNLKCLLEYNGKQHYEKSFSGWNTEEHFQQTQQRDNEKRNFCQKNNIKLEEISFLDFNKLEDILLEICKKYNLIKE